MRRLLIGLVLSVFVVGAGLWLASHSSTYAAPSLQTTPTPASVEFPTEVTLEIGDSWPNPIVPGKFWVNITSTDGYERRYVVHIPRGYNGATPLPLLLSFHGYTSSAALNAQYTGLDVKADEMGFIVAYPEGLGDPPGWYQYSGANQDWADDVQFARDVIADLQERLPVDASRIYATGFSNGGGMAHRVACDMADVLAAAAPVGGTYIYNDACNPVRPMPIVAIHGLADSVNPYYGNATLTYGIPDWSALWVERNGCDTESLQSTTTTPRGATVTVDHYANCTDGADVLIYSIAAMDHVWPANFAPEVIWEFLAAHPMPQKFIDNPLAPAVRDATNADGATNSPTSPWLAVPPGDYVAQVSTNGTIRDYYLHVPDGYSKDVPAPLIISFHGVGENPPQHAQRTGLSQKANAEGFLVVYPGGTGNPLRFNHTADTSNGAPDDAQMTRDLIASLQNRFNIDPNRIFITGLSNGGGMAHRVACSLSDIVAAVAPVAGGILIGDPCTPDHPVAILMIHGDQDTIVPYDGDANVFATPLTATSWAERNGCTDKPIESTEGTVILQRWSDCPNGVEVVLRTYGGSGHVWPNDATDVIWEFFRTHPRAEAD